MEHQELVTDESRFLKLSDQCANVFQTNQRLPELVFRRAFSYYYAFEHGTILRDDFATCLVTLAERSADTHVNYMTIAPDPVDYYRKNCGFYGVASFDSSNIVENYTKVMYRNGSVDSFRARGGDVGVLWGASLKWGLFCDRISWELCILGSDTPLSEALAGMLGCFDGITLSRYLSSLYPNKSEYVKQFARTLIENYPSLG